MVGAAIQSSSQNRAQLIIGRIISGVGVGFGSAVVQFTVLNWPQEN